MKVSDLVHKIIRLDTVIHNNTYWYVIAVRRDPDECFVMEAVRLAKDYTLYRGMARHKFIAGFPEHITILDDEEARIMTDIYNNPAV